MHVLVVVLLAFLALAVLSAVGLERVFAVLAWALLLVLAFAWWASTWAH